MVSTRKNSRAGAIPNASEEPKPTVTPPKKQTQKKVASSSLTKTKSKATAGHKRKTEELAPESTKDESPAKHPKRVTVEEESDEDQPKRSLRRATLEGAEVSSKDQREEGRGEDIGEGVKDTEMIEVTEGAGGKGGKEAGEEENGVENGEPKPRPKPAASGSSAREKKVEESPIMEKGVVYFFFRPKVAVEHAESLDDVQRSYIVLRPLPLGEKLKDEKLQVEGHNRLITVPKKKLPTKGYEKFL